MVRRHHELVEVLRTCSSIRWSNNRADRRRDKALCQVEQGGSRHFVFQPGKELSSGLYTQFGRTSCLQEKRDSLIAARTTARPCHRSRTFLRKGSLPTRALQQRTRYIILSEVSLSVAQFPSILLFDPRKM